MTIDQFELEEICKILKTVYPLENDIPDINNIDIGYGIISYNRKIGGDMVLFYDFKKRISLEQRINKAKDEGNIEVVGRLEESRCKAGILIADAADHNLAAAIRINELQKSFLAAAKEYIYRMGELTPEFFESLNNVLYNPKLSNKSITFIYGEIHLSGQFDFISAAHPPPLVFSNEFNRLEELSYDYIYVTQPLGYLRSDADIDASVYKSFMPSKDKFKVNKMEFLGKGDIFILYTDGLSDHKKADEYYVTERLPGLLKRYKDYPVKEIAKNMKQDILDFRVPRDDISFVLIKKY